jgi:hypothetical protein
MGLVSVVIVVTGVVLVVELFPKVVPSGRVVDSVNKVSVVEKPPVERDEHPKTMKTRMIIRKVRIFAIRFSPFRMWLVETGFSIVY